MCIDIYAHLRHAQRQRTRLLVSLRIPSLLSSTSLRSLSWTSDLQNLSQPPETHSETTSTRSGQEGNRTGVENHVRSLNETIRSHEVLLPVFLWPVSETTQGVARAKFQEKGTTKSQTRDPQMGRQLMSQRINHRREGKRYQDNGPTWESRNPMAGCNSTHVARCRSAWRKIGRRIERRKGSHSSIRYYTGGGRQIPQIEDYENDEGQ